MDQQVDEWIDTLEQFAASLSPEARRAPSILMLEEMIETCRRKCTNTSRAGELRAGSRH